MITDEDRVHIRQSWKLVVPIAETAADLFYKRLFEIRPDYRSLFPEEMQPQKRKLVKMLAFIVRAIDFADADWRTEVPVEEDLMMVVLALGRRHSELYKIPDESYAAVGEALIWTLDYGLGEAFTDDVKRAWLNIYSTLVNTMKMGSLLVNREAALKIDETPLRLGEEAIVVTQNELGIDEAAMAVGEDTA